MVQGISILQNPHFAPSQTRRMGIGMNVISKDCVVWLTQIDSPICLFKMRVNQTVVTRSLIEKLERLFGFYEKRE